MSNKKMWVWLTAVLAVLYMEAAVLAASPSGRTKLVLAVYGEATYEAGPLAQIKKAFEARYPQFELDVQIIPFGEYITKITAMVASKTAPDVFITWAQYKATWADQGIIMDVTEFAEKDPSFRLDEFYPVIRDVVTYRGRIWGTPQGFSSAVWIVNADRFAERGLPLPSERWTVHDLLALARKTTAVEKGYFGTELPLYGIGGGSLQWFYNYTGRYWLSEDGRRSVIAEPEAIEMVEFWRRLLFDEKVAPSVKNPMLPNRDEWSGAIAMWEGWLAYLQRFETLRQELAKKGQTMWEWKLYPYPAGPYAQKNFAQGHMWSIPAGARNPQASWLLASWLASREAEEIWARTGHSEPQRPDAGLWSTYLAFFPRDKAAEVGRFILQTLYGKSYALNFNYPRQYDRLEPIVRSALARIFEQGAAVANTLQQAADQMNRVLSTGA